MEKATAKVFVTGRNQAVRIPKQYRFTTDEVFLEQDGERLILSPKPKSWAEYFASPTQFTDNFSNYINKLTPEKREPFASNTFWIPISVSQSSYNALWG